MNANDACLGGAAISMAGKHDGAGLGAGGRAASAARAVLDQPSIGYDPRVARTISDVAGP